MLRTALAAGLTTALTVSSVASAQPAPAAPPAVPAPAAQPPASGDPLEPINRRLYWVHKKLDRYVVRPISLGYQAVTPRPVRKGLRNVIDNLGEPVTFVNDVLQLQPSRAGSTLARFTINSTVGVGGIFDVASTLDIPVHYEDFGQTLGHWGVGPGPYLFIPLIGPSNVRDSIGRAVDWQVSPLSIPSWQITEGERWAVAVVDAVDFRASVDGELVNLEQTATDEYATVRSAYQQNRTSEIANGQTSVDDLPDFDTPGQPSGAQPPGAQSPAQTSPPPSSTPPSSGSPSPDQPSSDAPTEPPKDLEAP
ncbi:MAG: VacJ family lipoprotein [Caulobacter sp.]|nr:VacJ family lipoprotein [Caulobacter sp.]